MTETKVIEAIEEAGCRPREERLARFPELTAIGLTHCQTDYEPGAETQGRCCRRILVCSKSFKSPSRNVGSGFPEALVWPAAILCGRLDWASSPDSWLTRRLVDESFSIWPVWPSLGVVWFCFSLNSSWDNFPSFRRGRNEKHPPQPTG